MTESTLKSNTSATLTRLRSSWTEICTGTSRNDSIASGTALRATGSGSGTGAASGGGTLRGGAMLLRRYVRSSGSRLRLRAVSAYGRGTNASAVITVSG